MSRWCWECPRCGEFWVDWITRCIECDHPQPADAYDDEDDR
jgi:predicted RNA-binding Zn-ribbon protein involved in translation (DUF1610 family)